MAQWPTYDPSTVTDVSQATDIAVQNEFQPGSTAKVMTAAAAFEHGGQTPMSAYNIPYQIDEGGQLIHGRGVGARRAVHHRRDHRALLQRRHLPGRRPRPPAGPVRLPAGVRPRPADRHRAAGGDRRRPAPGLAVVPGHPVHAGVRPGRGGDRDPDGRGLRDDRQRRRAGAADAGRGHDQLRGQVHPGRGLARQAGHPDRKPRRNCGRSWSRSRPSTRRAASPGASSPATRSRPRPGPRRNPTELAPCASTGRATLAWRPATTRNWSSR